MPEGTPGPSGPSRTTKATGTKAGEFAEVVREQLIGSVKQSQQIALDVVTTWADVVGKVIPPIPTLPFVPPVPELNETVQITFDVAQELLNAQREFATNLVSALAAATPR
jgi:hypothetical protein